jgi:TolB-like protein/Tfp pilus assembly protein PilF
MAVLVGAAAAVIYFASGNRAINSVAVLPFVNASGDPNTEYLSDGISESLINNLSRLPQLKVIARGSSFKYRGKDVDLQEVANALGVQAIVTGRVMQHGDQLQVSAELADTRDKTQMWGEQYNRKATDLQAVQEEIGRIISEKLRLHLTGAQEQQLMKRATENSQAYQLYLNGVFYGRKGGSDNQKKALDYFNQAIALDPDFALAHANAAVVYSALTDLGVLDPSQATPKAKAAAQRALDLDETLAEAHAAMALIKNAEWDWPGVDGEYKRAIELNSSFAAAHANYAIYLSIMGRHAEALTEIKQAQELDPLRVSFRFSRGIILQNARRYDDAIEQYQTVIKMQPDFSSAYAYLGYTYAAKGMYAEALAEYQKVIGIEGETTTTQAFMGYAYAMSGKRDEAHAILDKLKTTKDYVSPAESAILYAGLGDKEEAFAALERAYTAHDPQMQYLKVESHYDSLRSDPRFASLVRKVGFTP